MKVLLDTNILVDYLLLREPFNKEAGKIITLCHSGTVSGYAAAHSFTNMFFILLKDFSLDDRRKYLKSLCGFIKIAAVGDSEIKSSLDNSKFQDLEDCVQAECARAVGADYIITRNIKDHAESVVPALTPGDFLKMIK